MRNRARLVSRLSENTKARITITEEEIVEPRGCIMQIDVIIDTICPWCYIGQRRLARALAARADIQATFAWRPYQLNPQMPPEGKERRSYQAAKFGGRQRAARHSRAVERSGSQEGVEFRFDAIERTPNTLDSHRLIAYAAQFGVGAELVDRLFRAYFVEGFDISDHQTLVSLGSEIGRDATVLLTYLSSDEDRACITAEDEHVRLLGVNSVPCYIFAERYAVSGAQSPEVFL